MVARSLATRKASLSDSDSQPFHVFDAPQLQRLIENLKHRGYSVLGPIPRDGAVVYGPIESVQDLPQGWTDQQSPAHYRLQRRSDEALFGYGVGPQSWKKYLHPAEIRLWSAERDNGAFRILKTEMKPAKPMAFLGMRACELAAISIQDRVLLEDRCRDPIYRARRADALFIAVQCTQAAETCFCASLGTGPSISGGADLVLTELSGQNGHRFLAQAGTERGAELLAELPAKPASTADLEEAHAAVEGAAKSQSRSLDRAGLKEILYQNFDHPHWENVAVRCLTCANCTLVCPTCFCTTVEDVSDVSGGHAERWRRWDSCFTEAFSYIHGGSIRNSAKARDRQWVTHKLASWSDQFGSSGCVGCGRCITWCPAGIDITEEIRALREGENHGNT